MSADGAASSATPAEVTLRGVDKTFRHRSTDRRVLGAVDLTVAPGEAVAVLGASGSGKSTLLRLVAGLDRATRGEVTVGGEPVRGLPRQVAVVFQEPRLLPWRTLAGNVAFGLPPGTPRATGRAEVDRWLHVVGLAGFARHRPRQVSGGMAHRAALARALARRPGVLLLDEPFASLDALTRLRMQDLLDEVQRLAGTTVLLVTHDVEEALRVTDRVVLLGADPTGAPGDGATIRTSIAVPGHRPRDRADPRTAELRLDLLDRLGLTQPHEEPVR